MSDTPGPRAVTGTKVGADALAHFDPDPISSDQPNWDVQEPARRPTPAQARQVERAIRRYEVAWEDDGEPIWFAIPCKDRRTGEVWEEEFAASADPGYGGLDAYGQLVIITADGKEMLNTRAVGVLMRRVLSTEDYQRWQSLVDDNDITMHSEAVAKAVRDLVEVYTGHPLDLSSDSPRSQRRHGQRSTGKRR